MKEAIEILERYKEAYESPWGLDFIFGFEKAIEVLEDFAKEKHTYDPSPDTPYKIALTEWIESKVCNTQEIWDKQ